MNLKAMSKNLARERLQKKLDAMRSKRTGSANRGKPKGKERRSKVNQFIQKGGIRALLQQMGLNDAQLEQDLEMNIRNGMVTNMQQLSQFIAQRVTTTQSMRNVENILQQAAAQVTNTQQQPQPHPSPNTDTEEKKVLRMPSEDE